LPLVPLTPIYRVAEKGSLSGKCRQIRLPETAPGGVYPGGCV
jgi:hypothetical protein